MGKHKSGVPASLPKEQRSQFLIGPVISWFMPNTTDIWTQSLASIEDINDPKDSMDCDQRTDEHQASDTSLSYFIYGSLGCFCYGEIHHHPNYSSQGGSFQQEVASPVTMTINRLIDIKEDNSRVACVRFLKGYSYPLAMVLTCTGSFLIHNCLKGEIIVRFKRSEMNERFIDKFCVKEKSNGGEHNPKRTKIETRQINSCLWPDATNAFLGISLLRERRNSLIWLKMKDLTKDLGAIDKNDLIVQHQKIELEKDMPQYASICCMQSAMLDTKTCIVAVAMDDGFIDVLVIDLEAGKTKRSIKLQRHNDQICSLSLYTGNIKKHPLGLLASVSRSGLTLVWDIENELYFADYQASTGNKRVNWFTACLVPFREQVYLTVSNPDGGLTTLELPKNIGPKIRLMDNKEIIAKPKDQKDAPAKRKGVQGGVGNSTLRHYAVLFNLVHDPNTYTIVSSSLDENHILWTLNSVPAIQGHKKDKKDPETLQLVPRYLYPSMSNDSRTHMLRFNPIKEDLLGMALGKGRLKFFKMSDNPRNSRFDMNTSCGVIARKIKNESLTPTSLAWHPSHEYRVAIGTIEGKVFRADLTPNRATLVQAEHKPIAVQTPKIKQDDGSNHLFGVNYQPLTRDIILENPSDRNEPKSGGGSQLKTDGFYSLCWGPNPTCPEDVSRLAVYAVGSMSRRLFIYYNRKDNNDKMINYLQDEFQDQSLPEAIDRSSEVAWRSSMDLMALGTSEGQIIIVSYLEESHADRSKNRLFRKLVVIRGPFENAPIQCLAWHPTTDSDDARYHYLAAASNHQPSAYVFNLRESLLVADVRMRLRVGYGAPVGSTREMESSHLLNEYESTSDNHMDGATINHNEAGSVANDNATPCSTILSQFAHELVGHKKPISDLVWNPHKPNQIASSSFDRSCCVWSVDRIEEHKFMEAKMVARFYARDRLFSLEWSLVDQDLILTSGHDSTIWAWRPSENPANPNEPVESSYDPTADMS